MLFLATTNALVFLALAGLHAYWALGGQAGLQAALPAQPNGSLALRPGPALTWVVALALLLLAALSLAHLRLPAPGWLRLADAATAALFALRGVGDFRYVGLTKRVHDTTFARLDTRWYTPLCLALAASGAALALAAR